MTKNNMSMARNYPKQDVQYISKTDIPPETHEEYMDYHDKMDTVTMNDFELREESKKLFRKREPIEEKKKILFLLAHHNTLWFLYAIQRYLKNPDKELVPWAVLAWQESHGNILGSALEKFGIENDTIVIGGMGGDGEKTRCCFALSTDHGMFPNKRRIHLRKALHAVAKQYKVAIEEVLFGRTYARVIALVPHNVAVGDFIEAVINECNKPTSFLRFHYFVVNNHVLSREEIKEYVRELQE